MLFGQFPGTGDDSAGVKVMDKLVHRGLGHWFVGIVQHCQELRPNPDVVTVFEDNSLVGSEKYKDPHGTKYEELSTY